MKTALVIAGVLALSLSACDKKQTPVPVAPPTPKVQATAAIQGSAMSDEDKAKAMEAAKALAKSAGAGKE